MTARAPLRKLDPDTFTGPAMRHIIEWHLLLTDTDELARSTGRALGSIWEAVHAGNYPLARFRLHAAKIEAAPAPFPSAADPFAQTLQRWLYRAGGGWEGPPGDAHTAAGRYRAGGEPGWPGTASAFATALTERADVLRAAGITVTSHERGVRFTHTPGEVAR